VGDENLGFRLDSAWLKKFGVTQGTTAADWVTDRLTAQALTPYFGPDDAELNRNHVTAVFLGYYFPWDPQVSLTVARKHGFRPRAEGPLTGYYDYADIDDYFISIHHYLKWYKFGFTRLFDNLSLEIRNERMTRDQAIATLRKFGSQLPREDIDRFCRFVGISTKEFFDIIEPFRNPRVWTRHAETWKIDGFLVPEWDWS
jgi:hypothetical protein